MSQVALGSFHSVVLAGSRTQSVYTWAAWRPNPAVFFEALVLKCFLFLGLGHMLILQLLHIFRENLQVGTRFRQVVNFLFLAKVMAKPWATRWVVASPCLLWWFRWKTPRLRQGPKAVREISMQSLVAC